MLAVSGERHVRILLYGVVHVIPDNPHRPRAPITKHKVGWDVDVDLTAGAGRAPCRATHGTRQPPHHSQYAQGVPRQHGEAVTVQAPHAQVAVLEGAVQVV
jgi:hypothetical protein